MMYNQSPIELLTDNICLMIEENVEKLKESDPISQNDMKEQLALEERYYGLDLPKEQRMLINDYLACLKTITDREKELAFVVGMKMCLEVLKCMPLEEPPLQ
ncbi:MAG: hypothetical protein IJ411_00745 [Oscillospiraceae bacterium]|nr:hypothetical protein [Oscillospiraceae bacterium]